MTNNGDSREPCCKIGSVVESCGLVDLNAALHDRWTAAVDRSSVRELADFVNERVLRSELRASNEALLEGEVENYYRLLTDDDVSGGMRTEARNRLRNQGVDVATLEERFVSHQTVYRHLTGCMSADRGSATTDPTTAVLEGVGTIRALQRRTEAVTTSTIERFARSGHLDVGNVDVLVDVNVSCRDCGERLPLSDTLLEWSCDCVG